MEIDESEESSKRVEALQNLISKRSLQSSLAKLSGSSRGIPYEKDFHFYNNFAEFKSPIKQADDNSKQILKRIGAASEFWAEGKETDFPEDSNDLDLEPLDWLVDINDDIMEKFDVSLDDFRRIRKEEEGSGVRMMKMGVEDEDGEDGFHMVSGRKKKGRGGGVSAVGSSGGGIGSVEVEAKTNIQVATKVKPKVPFHIPNIPRPQDEYKIIVNNSNQPFEHVWLQRSEDGSRLIHPAEKFSPLDFVDKSVDTVEPLEPPPLESTPFKLVEQVKDLKAMAAKLRDVDEFAVDLEHNQYRSFQGLTCLIQISTRTEDFVVDTLKLRIQVGPYLREVFKDSTKKKVMHGSERDILWLQRDFGIYVCNLFDTGQASRVLKLERYSLEYLLHHFCGVTANKEYQNAEWRLRPLPLEMVRYAREDTHYLLYIYDLMRKQLVSLTPESEQSDPPLVEVYKRSYDICMQLYEKELLTDDSYLHIYGVQGADLTPEQLAVVSGLCEWRDIVARAEDESTGYILPNKTLIELAKQMPLTTNKLRWLVKSKHPYVERNLGSVVSIIRHSIQNAANFQAVVEYLKDRKEQRALKASEDKSVITEGSEVLSSESPKIFKTQTDIPVTSPKLVSLEQGNISCNKGISFSSRDGEKPWEECYMNPDKSGNGEAETDDGSIAAISKKINLCEPIRETDRNISSAHHVGATVQVLKKPSHAFGALLGNSAKRKFQPDKKEPEQIKLEQIKSEVNLPFHAFLAKGEPATEDTATQYPARPSETSHLEKAVPAQLSEIPCHDGPVPTKESEISHCQEPILSSNSKVEDLIIFDSDGERVSDDSRKAKDDTDQQDSDSSCAMGIDNGDETVSLADLSSSFQKFFEAVNEKKINSSQKSQERQGFLDLKPFDYEAARKQVKFGKDPGAESCDGDDEDRSRRSKGHKKGNAGLSLPQMVVGNNDLLPQGKRRQAFPASGNRSATFR